MGNISPKGPRAARTPNQYVWDGSNDVFTFGKYKGKTIIQVLVDYPDYINWLYREVGGLCINPLIFEKINQKNIQIDLPSEIINSVQKNYINQNGGTLTEFETKKADDFDRDEFTCVLLDDVQSGEPIVPVDCKIQPIQNFVSEEKSTLRNTTQFTKNEFNILTQEQKNESGGLGEEIAYRSLIKHFQEKYRELGSEINKGEDYTTLTNEAFIHAEIIWESKRDKFSKYDILVIDKLDGEFFYEVKSTFSESKDYFDISINEWEFAQEKGDKYHILRISNVKSEKPIIVDYPNPFKLFQEGKIAIKSLELEL